MAIIKVNFKGAPPSQGTIADRIPDGDYRFEVVKMVNGKAQSGKEMITASYAVARGDQKGKRIVDRFAFPDAKDDSMFGLQRFHAMLLACGIKVPADKAFNLDLDKVVGKAFDANVGEGEMPPRNGRPAIKTTQIREYKIPTGAARSVRPPDDEDEEDEDEPEDEEDEDEDADADADTDDEEEEPEPEPIARRRGRPRTATATAPAPTAERRNGNRATRERPARARREPEPEPEDEDEGDDDFDFDEGDDD